METEDVYTLMMEALDGELSEAGWAELESHLRARPDLAREWAAMQAIDTLFRQTPALRPAADFTQRTVARLPHARQRLWVSLIIYLLLLASGLIPLGVIAWLLLRIGPALAHPALLRGLWQAGGELLGLAQLIIGALLRGAGEFVAQQPAVWAGFLLMVGAIALWGGVYNRLVLRSRRA